MSTLIDIFNSLYEENKETIYMNESGKYKIDKVKVNSYINENCIPNAKQLLKFIFENIIYIDFETFIRKIEEYLHEIYVHHRNGSNMKVNITIIIPGLNINKSNIWMALIIKKIIEDSNMQNFEIIDIVSSIREYSEKSLDETCIAIFPDDCSYSGDQIGKSLFDSMYEENPNFKVYPLIPFISNIAYNNFKNMSNQYYNMDFPPYLFFLENKITFVKNLMEICIDADFNIYKNDIMYYTLEDYKSKSEGKFAPLKSFILDIMLLPQSCLLIYFDHKIADQVSTIQYFLNYSEVLSDVYVYNLKDSLSNKLFDELKNDIEYGLFYVNSKYYNSKIEKLNFDVKKEDLEKYECNSNNTYFKIISNCDHIPYLKRPKKDILDYDLNKIFHDDIPYSCPQTFYKQPNFYKYNGDALDTSYYDNLNLLIEHNGGYRKKYLLKKKEYMLAKRNIF